METSLSDLFSVVRDLKLPHGDYAIFGSGPLIVRGIVPFTNDLDIVCRGPAWDYAKSIGDVQYLEEHGVTIASINDGQISFGREWGIGNFDIDRLIDDADTIDDLPFVRLQYVVQYKRIRNSAKDRSHIAALQSSKFRLD